ncbi:hypothetical protein ACLKA7_006088 [Drosophila subpalustris]
MMPSDPFNSQFCVMAHKRGLTEGEICNKIMKIPSSVFTFFTIDIMPYVLMALCANGVVNSLYTFVRICLNMSLKPTTTWQNNGLCLIPPILFRCLITLNRLLHLNSWILLSFAAYNYSAKLMIPWMVYHCAFLTVSLVKLFLKATLSHIERKDIKLNMLLFKFMAIIWVYCSMKYYYAFKSALSK